METIIVTDFFTDVGGILVAAPKFDGKTFSPAQDEARLTGQLARVLDLMSDGQFRTLAEISAATGDPESSVSARLRDLRKPKHGFFTVDRRRRGDPSRGLFEYQVRGKGL